MRRFLVPTFFLAVAIGSARAQDSSASPPATNGKSVLKGVFTDAQAARGDNEHQSFCTSCHSTTNYVSAAFTKAWVGRTVFDLSTEELRVGRERRIEIVDRNTEVVDAVGLHAGEATERAC